MSAPYHRYSSFDFCYNYFRSNDGPVLLSNLERSCAILGFYLASWGMMRASSFLLQRSYLHFKRLVEYIANVDRSLWEIQPDDYIEKYALIADTYSEVRALVTESGKRDVVLVTKVMLGVFGMVPAFDQYFRRCFKTIQPDKSKFARFNKNSLEVIQTFYLRHQAEIDRLSTEIFTFDFDTATPSVLNYPKAKIIDMYGFEVGKKMVERERTMKQQSPIEHT